MPSSQTGEGFLEIQKKKAPHSFETLGNTNPTNPASHPRRPWINHRIFLEKLTIAVHKLPAFYRTCKSTVILTTA
jgi:hypothetical protein